MTAIRNTLEKIARTELDWHDGLPTGSLAESFDSLQLLTLVVAIEDEFEITLDPEDEARLDTIEDVVELIAARGDYD